MLDLRPRQRSAPQAVPAFPANPPYLRAGRASRGAALGAALLVVTFAAGPGVAVAATGAPPSAGHAAAQTARESPAGAVSIGRAQPLDAELAAMDVRIERCGRVLRSYWRDPDGTLRAADELELDADGALASYRYWLPPIAESISVTRDGRRARIVLRQGDSTKTRELDVPDGVHVGPMLVIRARDVARGTHAPGAVPLLVVERFTVLDFEVRTAGSMPPRAPQRDVALRASSALVRRFVDPVQIAFDRNGEVARLRGRVLPATGSPGRKQPMEVDLVLEPPYEAPCSAARLAHAPS